MPPVPTLPVTCVPNAMPEDAVNGAPISGAPPDCTVNGITSSPLLTINAGRITPLLPLLSILNEGTPILAPV